MDATLEAQFRRARSNGYLLMRHPLGLVTIPGFGQMSWPALAVALAARAARSEPDRLVDLAEEIRAHNASLPLEIRGQAFTADSWDSSAISVIRNGQTVRVIRRANDPEVLLDVLLELSRDFGP